MVKSKRQGIENFLKKEGFNEVEAKEKSGKWYKKASEQAPCAKMPTKKRTGTGRRKDVPVT